MSIILNNFCESLVNGCGGDGVPKYIQPKQDISYASNLSYTPPIYTPMYTEMYTEMYKPIYGPQYKLDGIYNR